MLLCVQVGVLQQSLPNLQELHVAGNNISSLRLQLDLQQQQQQANSSSSEDSLAGLKSLQVRYSSLCAAGRLAACTHKSHCCTL
jgi:hypothetical protein